MGIYIDGFIAVTNEFGEWILVKETETESR